MRASDTPGFSLACPPGCHRWLRLPASGQERGRGIRSGDVRAIHSRPDERPRASACRLAITMSAVVHGNIFNNWKYALRPKKIIKTVPSRWWRGLRVSARALQSVPSGSRPHLRRRASWARPRWTPRCRREWPCRCADSPSVAPSWDCAQPLLVPVQSLLWTINHK